MPPKLSDYVSATEAFVVFEEEFEGSLIPIASNSFEGAGVHDEELAVSRPATPLDLQSIAPPSSWDDFGRVVDEIWAEVKLKEVVLTQVLVNWTQMQSITGNPVVFAEAVAHAYSNYIEYQIDEYLELARSVIAILIDLQQCQFDLLTMAQEELLKILFDKDGKASLEQAKVRLLQHVASDEKCKVLIEVVDAMISLHEAWIWIKNTSLSEIWEEIGHVATILAELLRRIEIQQTILSFSSDPSKLGTMYGTLIGIIIWEVIEEVASAGLGKGLRFLKVVH